MRYAQTKLHYICGFIFYDARHTRHVCTHRRCRRSMGSTTPASADTDACPSMKIDYGVRSKTQLLLALVFVLVVVPCTFKYAVPVFWQLYFSGVEVMVCGLVVDKKESECFVHLPRSIESLLIMTQTLGWRRWKLDICHFLYPGYLLGHALPRYKHGVSMHAPNLLFMPIYCFWSK